MTFYPKEIHYHGIEGHSSPKPIQVYSDFRVLPPDFFRTRFYRGFHAISGRSSLVKTLESKDSTLYLYQMRTEHFPTRIDTNVQIGETVYFVSKSKLSPGVATFIYKDQVGFYRNFFCREKRVNYFLVVDGLGYSNHYVFEYVDEKKKRDYQPIFRALDKKVPTSRINKKIAKAIRKLKN